MIKRRVFTLLIAVFFCLSGLPVLADAIPAPKLYNGISMDDLAETLLLEGLRFVQVPIDGKGVVANQRFDVNDGVQWSVLGYDCERADGCSELQLRSVFRTSAEATTVLVQLNLWNASNRFTRAYAMGNSNILLEMDIYLSGGQSLKNIREQITIWRQSVRRFSSTMTSDDANL